MRLSISAFRVSAFLALLAFNAHAQQSLTPEFAKKLFTLADANGDGKLSREELPERMRPNFEQLDTNHDGLISLEEYLASLPHSGVQNSVESRLDLPYANTDNPRQRLDLYLPKTPHDSKPLPVVVFIHGGGWQNGDKSAGGKLVAKFVESTGYAGVSLGYRLTNEAHWPAQIHDCKAAIRWIKAHAEEYHLDAAKIAAWGGSAGGHLASMLGASGDVKELEGTLGNHLDQDSRIACVVNYFGPQDLLTIRPRGSIDKTKAKNYPESLLVGGLVFENEEVAKEASPVTWISAGDPPFFTAHGTADPIVPFSQAEELHAALVKAGVPSTFQKVINGGHGFPNAELDKRTRQFLDLHLRGIPCEISTVPIELPSAK